MSSSLALVSRRAFIKNIIFTTYAASGLGCSFFSPTLDELAKHLSSLLDHPPLVNLIGSAYTTTRRDLGEQTLQATTSLLLNEMGIDNNRFESLSNENIVHTLEQKIRQDFVDENTTVINGWLLSRTEVLLCVLHNKLYPTIT
ncbi:MAG: hypothetical protein CL388_02670 [Acidiferrobacteraceae bacterium]|jgi:hypothetical protein|nr:hypothetical protein [Acidiferrobacteraceae bacterium]MDP6434228.1 hypothetical protein [Arenicellales bacterium]MDP6671843.1 hypothetical protein [Arenicellales bacterium]MDP6723978.1 hypothetical protein [Arenicellales bacterium]|tara:strand:- start:4408 stop:4836 length:429 start_codon:yes stop_codon:yes gene_type:complete